MATAKRISWSAMTADQQARVRKSAEKFGLSIYDVIMVENGHGGLIVHSHEQMMNEDRQIVARGYVDKVADVTDEVREQYRKDKEICNAYGPVKLDF